MAVMEFEHRPHRLRRDPAVVLDQPVDPLRAVGQQIFRGKPRSLDDGLAAALSGHGLDQRALGPVNVCHRRIVTQAVTRRQKTRLSSMSGPPRDALAAFYGRLCGGWGMRQG